MATFLDNHAAQNCLGDICSDESWSPKWSILRNRKDRFYYTPHGAPGRHNWITEESPMILQFFLVMPRCVKTCPSLLTPVSNSRCLDPLFQLCPLVLLQFSTLSHESFWQVCQHAVSWHSHIREPGTPGIHGESSFLENNFICKFKTHFPLGTSLEDLLLKT